MESGKQHKVCYVHVMVMHNLYMILYIASLPHTKSMNPGPFHSQISIPALVRAKISSQLVYDLKDNATSN